MINRFGFKEITESNIFENDAIFGAFKRLDGKNVRSLTFNDWYDSIESISLNQEVPDDIQKQFEVCRGSLYFGFYYHPLNTVVFGQITRVTEAALRLKYAEITGSEVNGHIKMNIIIKKLMEREILNSKEEVRWKSLRELRNWLAHPKTQDILPPYDTVNHLAFTAKIYNDLWPNSPTIL
jgi:hypothetical protein